MFSNELFMDATNLIVSIVIPVIAALGGAYYGAKRAFDHQRNMEVEREKRGLMQMLMGYRTIGAVDVEWVRALNMIDIVYHDNKKIKALLRKYMYYTDSVRYSSGDHKKVLEELLYEMGQSCGYTDLTENDIRDGYNPISLPHIYASTLERFSQEGKISDPPPNTTLEIDNGMEVGK